MNKNPIITNSELYLIPVYSPWYHVASNVVSPMSLTFRNGNCFILTVSEYFTKWVEAILLLSKCGHGVTESLFNVMIIVKVQL